MAVLLFESSEDAAGKQVVDVAAVLEQSPAVVEAPRWPVAEVVAVALVSAKGWPDWRWLPAHRALHTWTWARLHTWSWARLHTRSWVRMPYMP